MEPIPRKELQQLSDTILSVFEDDQSKLRCLNPVALAYRFSLPITFVPFLQQKLHALGLISTSDTLCYPEEDLSPYLNVLQVDHIYLDSRLRENYYDFRFVLTHEIAHYCLARFLPDLPQAVPVESCANYLASCLLLPEMAVRRKVLEPVPCCEFDGCYHFPAKEEFFVRSLCRYFGVYRKTMIYRLQDLRLLSYLSVSRFMELEKHPLVTERTVHCA